MTFATACRKTIITPLLALLFLQATAAFCVEPVDLAFFKQHPALLNKSSLSLDVDKSVKKPTRPYLGAFGIGGMNAFTVMGLDYPFNTYHNTTTYHSPFFGDSRVGVTIEGNEVVFPRDSIWYVRGASIAVTREEDDQLAMFTVNFSPPGSDSLVRFVVLKALKDVKGIRLFASVEGDYETKGDTLIQTRDSEHRERKLIIGSIDKLGRVEDGRLVVDIQDMKKDEEKIVSFYYVIWTMETQIRASLTDDAGYPFFMLKHDEPRLIDDTVAAWQTYLSGSTRIITPDQRLNDMFDNLKIAHRIQRNRNGALVPVVKYADRSHDRENVHSTRYYLLTGMPDDAREIMMYGWYAAQAEGVIYNSQAADLDIINIPAVTDWDKIPLDNYDPIRHVAERPSWTVLQFWRYYKHTGDLETIRKVYPYLRRNILGQEITPEGLMPFHGDEMYQITYPTYASKAHLEKFYSLESSLAFSAAARGMEELAGKLGEKKYQARVVELRNRVEAAVEKYYWLDDGWYATGLQKDTLKPVDRMFPLIGISPALIGYEGNPERLRSNFLKNLQKLRRKDGTLKMAPGVGLYHGQLQGIFLYNLKYYHHPLAASVFDMLIHTISDPAGMFSEVQTDNHSHASMSVNKNGLGKEDARRFGPWESALNISSLVDYLTGLSVDADKMQVRLIPEMPNDWHHWELLDGKVKRNLFDFFVDDAGSEMKYRFVNKGPDQLALSLDLPLGKRAPEKVFINGKEQPKASLDIETVDDGFLIKNITGSIDKNSEITVVVIYR